MNNKELEALEQETLKIIKDGNRKNLMEFSIVVFTIGLAFYCVIHFTYLLSRLVENYTRG